MDIHVTEGQKVTLTFNFNNGKGRSRHTFDVLVDVINSNKRLDLLKKGEGDSGKIPQSFLGKSVIAISTSDSKVMVRSK